MKAQEPVEQFVIDFETKSQLKAVWTGSFAAGTCFIPTAKPAGMNADLHLLLKVTPESFAVMLPARVIQHLKGQTPQSSGMVLELVGFARYRNQVLALLEAPADDKFDVKDFTSFAQFKGLEAAEIRALVQRARAVVGAYEKNHFYEVLGVAANAGRKEIRDRYFEDTRRFHPDHFVAGEYSDEVVKLFEMAFQRLSQAYEVVRDEVKRAAYDKSRGDLVRTKDESEADYRKKKTQYLHDRVREENSEIVQRAEKLFNEALKSVREGDLRAAMATLKIASQFDPYNNEIKKKLKEIEKKVKDGSSGTRN